MRQKMVARFAGDLHNCFGGTFLFRATRRFFRQSTEQVGPDLPKSRKDFPIATKISFYSRSREPAANIVAGKSRFPQRFAQVGFLGDTCMLLHGVCRFSVLLSGRYTTIRIECR